MVIVQAKIPNLGIRLKSLIKSLMTSLLILIVIFSLKYIFLVARK